MLIVLRSARPHKRNRVGNASLVFAAPPATVYTRTGRRTRRRAELTDRYARMCGSPRVQRGYHLRSFCALIGYIKGGAFLQDTVADNAPLPGRVTVWKRRASSHPLCSPNVPGIALKTRKLPVISETETEERTAWA